MFIVIYRDTALRLQSVVLKYPLMCYCVVVFEKLCEVVDGNINRDTERSRMGF